MEQFVPSRPVSGQTTAEDREYAEAFKSLAEITSECDEAVVLRLSTCRNAFLTANALYVDVRYILGHGRTPSLLSSAIKLAGRGDILGVKGKIDQAKIILSQIHTKKDVWARRVELDSTFSAKLESLSLATKQRIYAVLDQVRIEDPDTKSLWPVDYYRISLEEPSQVRVALANIDSVVNVVASVISILAAIPAMPETDDLFVDREAPGWARLYEALISNASTMDFLHHSEDNLAIVGETGEMVEFCETFPGNDKARNLLDLLLEHLSRIEQAKYKFMLEEFDANTSKRMLPDPFEIVFLGHHPTGTRASYEPPEVKRVELNCQVPTKIHIALPGFGVPPGFYKHENKEYVDNEKRSLITSLAKRAIVAAGGQGANVLIFPEYFLPRDSLIELEQAAKEADVILIGGIEARTANTRDHSLINEAIIYFPGIGKRFNQRKFRPSNIEPPFMVDPEEPLWHFVDSPLGSFCVLICSDFREIDILTSVARAARRFHTLYIVSCNTQTELFETFAIADACRLQCHVVVSNNFAGPEDGASSNGSMVCSPMTSHEKRKQLRLATKGLGGGDIGGLPPEILIFELNLGDVSADGEKPPAPGYLPTPHCRKVSE